MSLQISRQTINYHNEKNAKQILIHDCNEDLDLFCSKYSSKDDLEFIKKCRGIIIPKYMNNPIVNAYNHNDEYSAGDRKAIKKLLDYRINECEYYHSIEGCLIRLFYYNEKWYMSTHRKLDAFKCNWVDKTTYGSIFIACMNEKYENFDLDDFYSTLDISLIYTFLLSNNKSNRIVCDAVDKPTIYFTGVFKKNSSIPNMKYDLVYRDIPISKPTRIIFDNYEQLCDYIENDINYKKLQGIIVYDNILGKQYKILNSKYSDYFSVRGNEMSIMFRYIQIINDDEQVKKLFELYPEYLNQTFYNKERYDNYILKLINRIENELKNYRNKQTYKLNQLEYEFVFKKIRDDESINITDFVYKLDAHSLNKIINSYKQEDKNRENLFDKLVDRFFSYHNNIINNTYDSLPKMLYYTYKSMSINNNLDNERIKIWLEQYPYLDYVIEEFRKTFV